MSATRRTNGNPHRRRRGRRTEPAISDSSRNTRLPSVRSLDYGPSSTRESAEERDARIVGGNNPGLPERDTDRTPKPAVVKPPTNEDLEKELKKIINVKSVDLHIEENTKRHRTDKYACTRKGRKNGESPELVIRRGDNFLLTLTFNRPYDRKRDDLYLSFISGSNPLPKYKNFASFPLNEAGKSNEGQEWNAVVQKEQGPSLTLSVHVPPDCVIGEWQFSVKTTVEGNDENDPKVIRYSHKPGFTILLNPWCKDDTVYLQTEKLLDEYVLNDSGAVFYGSEQQVASRPWFFGQFDEGIMEICLHILRKSFGFHVDRNMADAVQISRALAKIVNDCDDQGVVSGRWDGMYDDGQRPTYWVGSVNILEQYEKTGKPVKYGQCWVFSAVLTTVCRAVGLPCRSVTNFSSAHDTDVSCTIDTVYELEDGIPIKTYLCEDSIWNFHVWNEVWMARPDLPTIYSGWQVIDATPQERSDGMFVCGPCPVEAVKRGDLSVSYDVPFVFAEVNADAVQWIKLDDDELYVMNVDKKKVGKKISTKKATGESFMGALSVFGEDKEREDLTLRYKFPEGSAEEREAVNKAITATSNKLPKYDSPTPVKVTLEIKDHVMVGEDFAYQATVTNGDQTASRTLQSVLVFRSTRYDGSEVRNVKAQRFPKTVVKPGENYLLTATLTAKEYLGKLPEGFAMEIQAYVFVREDHAYKSATHIFRLRRPDLVIKGPKSLKKKETVKLEVTLDNPLGIPMTKCILVIEGGLVSLDGQDKFDCSDVPARGKWEKTFEVKLKDQSTMARRSNLNFSFDCEELPDITGYYNVALID